MYSETKRKMNNYSPNSFVEVGPIPNPFCVPPLRSVPPLSVVLCFALLAVLALLCFLGVGLVPLLACFALLLIALL